MNAIKVLIGSPELSRRTDLAAMLRAQEDIELIELSKEWRQMLRRQDDPRPDVLIINADDGLAGTSQTDPRSFSGRLSPAIKTLLVYDSATPELVAKALKQKMLGCIAKNATAEHILKAIRAVYQGELWLGRHLMAATLLDLAKHRPHDELTDKFSEYVTDREQEIINYVWQGMTNKEIGHFLGISDKTVKAHLSHIYKKLHVHRRIKLNQLNG